MSWQPLLLTLRVAALASLIIVLIGLTLAWVLARYQFTGKLLLEILVLIPLVIPPSVLGFYLLQLFGRDGVLAALFHIDILFTWQAAVIASVIVGLPLMIQPARAGLAEVDRELEDAARVDGARGSQVMRFITLPLARRSILAGVILASARAMGEFGVTLMIAGNIPGRTQTLPLAIYDAVQTRQYDEANMMVLVLSALALVYIWGLVQVGRPIRLRKHKEKPHFSHSSLKTTGSSTLLFQRYDKSKILDVIRVTSRDRS